MAISAQGVMIRRESTGAGSTAGTGSTTLVFDATAIRRTGAGDFIADGFTTAMRVWTTYAASSNVGKIYTIHNVAATVLGIFETMTTSTSFTGTLNGLKMTNIGDITNFTGPGGNPSIIDITNLQSTAKEKLVSLPDEGQLTLEVNFNTSDAMQWALIADRKARQRRAFDIRFTDQTATDSSALPSNVMFWGYPTGFSISGGVDAAMKGSLTIEIDGQTYWSTKSS